MASNFKKRLKRLHDSRHRERAEEANEKKGQRVFTAEGVDEREASGTDEAASVRERWESIGAKRRQTERGPAHYLSRSHRQGLRHGDWRLVDGLDIELASLCSQVDDARIDALDPADLVFVDLETTGLSKSCYPFCVGIGAWEDASFTVYHFFMPTDEEEAQILLATAEMFEHAGALCTFNGKSFDLKMLRRRFERHGIDHNLDELPHIDLLPVARRLLPDRKSHKLSLLEEDVLGFEREDDIPGARIPARWNRYLKKEDPSLLENVFDHNRLDIVSMVVLLPALLEKLGEDDNADKTRGKRGKENGKRGKAPKEQAREPREERPKKKQKSKLASRLSRSYALRQKNANRRSQGQATKASNESGKEDEKERVSLEASMSRSNLRSGMPVGTRLRELRNRTERLIDEGRGDEALAHLHEMIALAPRHPWALEKLIAHHRDAGRGELARHYEKRLDDAAPY